MLTSYFKNITVIVYQRKATLSMASSGTASTQNLFVTSFEDPICNPLLLTKFANKKKLIARRLEVLASKLLDHFAFDRFLKVHNRLFSRSEAALFSANKSKIKFS